MRAITSLRASNVPTSIRCDSGATAATREIKRWRSLCATCKTLKREALSSHGKTRRYKWQFISKMKRKMDLRIFKPGSYARIISIWSDLWKKTVWLIKKSQKCIRIAKISTRQVSKRVSVDFFAKEMMAYHFCQLVSSNGKSMLRSEKYGVGSYKMSS